MFAKDAKELSNLSKLTPLFNTIKTEAQNGYTSLSFKETIDRTTIDVLVKYGYDVDRQDGFTIISWN